MPRPSSGWNVKEMTNPKEPTVHSCKDDGNRPNDNWQSIDWQKAERTVNQLQHRISKAYAEKRFDDVKRLQYLLVHSFHAKALAVRQVTEINDGKRTCGVDKELWLSDKQKMGAVHQLNKGRYRSKPLRRIHIPKKNGKLRPLSIPTIYDRAMQALYALAPDPVCEAQSDANSYGFRKGRGCHDVKEQLFILLAKKKSPQWVLEGDIRGCFDHISHEWLMKNVLMDKKILEQFLKAGYVFNKKMFPTEEGTPQGGVISPILANICLNGIEPLLKGEFIGTSRKRSKVHLLRYADDFIVTAPNEETAERARNVITDFLKERGLELSEEKTLITHVDEGFDFLGFNVRKYNGKLLIKPSKNAIKSLKDKIREIVLTDGKAETQDNIIRRLNPVLRGWSNYFKVGVSKEVFHYLEHYLVTVLMRWACRRHTQKGKKWVVNKYWHKVGTVRWTFCTKENTLFSIGKVKIKRHVKVQAKMNYYLDREYFDARKSKTGMKLERGYRNSSMEA